MEIETRPISKIKTMEMMPMNINNIPLLQMIVYWANIFVICSLVFTFLAGKVNIVSKYYLNKAKDEQIEKDKQKSQEGIASLKTKAEELKLDSEKAKEGIAIANQIAAEANARAEEAKLELAKFRAPRSLTEKQRAKIVADLKKFSGTVFDISASDNEGLEFAVVIADALIKAGWTCRNWADGGIGINLPGRPYIAGTVFAKGLVIQIRDPSLSKARDALVNTLKLVAPEGLVGRDAISPNDPNRNVMHIIVGTKP